jgi:hypothetical protein
MIEPMDQISIKTPNLKCRLFLKGYLAAGVYLSEAPDPLSPLCYTLYEYSTPVLIHIGKGGWGIEEPVRRLQGR